MTAAPLDLDDVGAVAQFIRANTRQLSPPLVPEIVLQLAEESVPIWQKTEEQLGELNIAPPYWAFAWAGGQALARYLLDHADVCRDARVIDLGCGSGLTAIAAAMTGARTVVAADIDRLALAAAAINATANRVTIALTSDDLLSAPPQSADVVLVGDLFYERQLADRVLAYIETAKSEGAKVLIGDPRRNYFPRDRFGLLGTYQVPVTRELEDSEIKNTSVWQA
ncbi:MAG: class I SAM-dependent methyltransferase [Hyphomicrobium sp.]